MCVPVFDGVLHHTPDGELVLGGDTNGLEILEILRPGVVPIDLPDDVASVQELKGPTNSVKNSTPSGS